MGKGRKVNKAKPSVSIPLSARSKSSASSASSSPISPVTPKTPADEGIEFFQSPLTPGEAPLRVYELRLDIDGGPHKDRSYIRLPPAYAPYILRVSIDAGTPASMNGVFKTNFPLDGGKFDRARFTERKLPSDFSKPIQIDLPISHAGAFVFWVEYDGEQPNQRIKGREGYFNIDPVLRIKARSPILSPEITPLPLASGAVLQEEVVNLPLDGLSILTVVSKWMGPLSEWNNHFSEAKDRGYTMLHYTPLQERGESDSPYSIRDQFKYDPSMFGGKQEVDGGKAKVEAILKIAREKYGLLSLTDVVLNHTANDSPWLADHPESGFSPANSPHLTSALELDTAMIEFSSNLASRGLPSIVRTQQDVDTLMNAFRTVIKDLNLWQYYVLDVAREKAAINAALTSDKASPWTGPSIAGKSVIELAEFLRGCNVILGRGELSSRFGVHSDANAAAGFIKAAFVELSDPAALADAWVRVLDVVNVPLYEEWEEDTKIAFDNVKNRLTYARLDENGPKLGEITKTRNPLVESYFTRCGPKPDSDPLVYSLANNGWIWAADPLQNFALLPSKAYLRREVIVWGDCVKLRYGSGPEDNPWLWSHMTSYVKSLASTFDGFRIDNCHSTPLHVGVSMLDAARVENPDLYVCAELFTGSEEMDLLFVKRLGINSLIRESYNGWDAKEYSRLLYRHGVGKPVGSMDAACLTSTEEIPSPTGKGPLRKAIVTPLNGSMPHALLYDLTHDNESPLHKRSAEDALSTGALVTFSYSATGSVKGFDDLYPKLLNLVGEKRKYEVTGVNEGSGIARIKRVLNALHLEMVLGGYEEGHVHQENDYIILSRVQPSTQKGYLLVAHTGFAKGTKDRGYISPIKLRRTRAKFIMGASIDIHSHDLPADVNTLKGLPHKLVEMSPVVVPQGLDAESPYAEIIVPEYFPPGSIMLFETHLQEYDTSLDQFVISGAQSVFGNLGLVELNVVLHRADGEERDATNGEIGVYDVPGLGRMTYCGLEGWMHPLRHIMRHNDLGHPLCEHLRQGTWPLDYVYDRLSKAEDLPNLKTVAQWFKERFDRIKATVPPFLRPKYFALVISEAYKAARRSVVEQCSEFVLTGHDFTQDLALCAVQMHGLVKSASLDPGKPTPSLAAGLPHFAAGWARCWGRDVFISLRGLFLTTGNFEGAKRHILAFASTLKHGLIPNLLDSVRKPRYNSRDSPWWMIQNIQDYVNMAPDGLALLSENVPRRFPKDETWVEWDDKRAYAYSSTIAEIIQEILQRHAQGIHFREYNAGPNLDMQMRDEGFNIDIDVDWKTGLISGGNAFNCGTWMDKMGESQKAGTKGQPGTPRDGAPVEITGLVKSALTWLDGLSTKGRFPFKGVQASVDGKERLVTYKEWADLIQASFEKCYYVPLDDAEDSKYNLDSRLANRRGIYKDVYGSGAGREWSDYQFRPNFPIAMTVAPELFDPQHGLQALQLADKVLRSPLGMKTLDPSDMQYRPIYDNSNDSTDAAIAKGLNYHNGPEWGWPLGFFLRAYLDFDTRVGAGKKDIKITLHQLHQALLIPRHHLQNDPWAGIPELTNANGQYCSDSCNTQAWSASTLLDFLEIVHGMNANVGK
ncbi:glycoside hydrolase family 13 protein [Lentinula aff. detonsa]|nr:glycoside hydrolase family 13 protein [Lentinula aff. detonsa]